VPHLDRQVRRADAYRAGRIAGHAIEAGVHLLDQVGTEFQLAFQTLAGQRYPSTWRGYLAQILAIRWADC
jgi:hypothetical protein